MRGAVLLLSSGLDSAANLALARDFDVKLALTLDYGQRGASHELRQAAVLARRFGIEHVTFNLSGFSKLIGGKSALLGEGDVPVPTSLDDLREATKTAAAVWVPNRNGVLISLAAALAESRGLDAVAVGFNAEEAVTFPDNTPAYMEAMSGSLSYSTANKVRVVSATSSLTKPQIVAALAEKSFPFELLWSCYQVGLHHCGKCESCQRLRRAIEAALSGGARARALESLFGKGSS